MGIISCSRCRAQVIGTARFCSRCGLALRSPDEEPRPAADAEPTRQGRRRWYQIGRLDASRAAWANYLLITLGSAAWLMMADKSDPTTATGAGGFCGAIVGTFGFCGAVGWIASSLAWRIGRKSQAAAVIGFALGAAGVFSLAALGNARIEQARATAFLPPDAQNGIPADRMSSAQLDDIFDQVALEEALKGRAPLPTEEERKKLAYAYLSGTMRADMVPVYEQAIRQSVVPNPADDWKGTMRLDRWQCLDALVPARPQIPPGFVLDPAPPAAPVTDQPPPSDSFAVLPSAAPLAEHLPRIAPPLVDIDLPAEEFRQLKATAHQAGRDFACEVREPQGWRLSGIVFEFIPVDDPRVDPHIAGTKKFFARRYTPLSGDDGQAHFYVEGAFNLLPGQKPGQFVNWRIVGARGHRVQ